MLKKNKKISNYIDIDEPIKYIPRFFFFTRFIRSAKRFQKPRVNPYIFAVINNGAFWFRKNWISDEETSMFNDVNYVAMCRDL